MRMRYSTDESVIDNSNTTGIELTFTKPLILAGSPTDSREASNKKYVDLLFSTLSANSITVGIISSARMPSFIGDVTNVNGNTVFTLTNTGISAGSHLKATVDSKGRVTGSGSLTLTDIPSLSWNKITKNRPTTLAGYGITDGIKITGDTIEGSLTVTGTPTNGLHAVTKGYVASVGGDEELSPIYPGTIVMSPLDSLPGGFLKANGGEVSKTTYADLYAVIGDEFAVSVNEQTPGSGRPWQQQYEINDLQSGDITGWTSSTINNLSLIALSQAIVTKNKVYLVSPLTLARHVAPIDANGNIGAFAQSNNAGVNASYGQVIVTKHRVYIIGGSYYSANKVVYTAFIDSNGDLSDWSTAANLPANVTYTQVIVTKNRVYVLGGHNGSSYSYKVYAAPIYANGAIGVWVEETSLPIAVGYSQAVVTKNRVYLIGGYTGSGASSRVFTAPINSDGTLGSWTEGPSLPGNLYNSQAFVTKNCIYLLGGHNGSVYTSVVYRALVDSDGFISNWTSSTSLPGPIGSSRLVVTKNKIHLIAGMTNGAWSSVVYSASIQGGLSDYSPYYDGSFTPVVPDTTTFRLPDYSVLENTNQKYYIKY